MHVIGINTANSTEKIEKYHFLSVIFEFLLIFASSNKVYANNCTTDCYGIKTGFRGIVLILVR